MRILPIGKIRQKKSEYWRQANDEDMREARREMTHQEIRKKTPRVNRVPFQAQNLDIQVEHQGASIRLPSLMEGMHTEYGSDALFLLFVRPAPEFGSREPQGV